jgi:acyl-homoserine lactone acylase PvdQ
MMTQVRSVVIRLPIGLLAIALLAQLFVVSSAQAVQTQDQAPAQAQPLASQALILRDQYGVPHIQASSEEAAAFAHGYAIAEDHAAELARLFLRARGELAFEFGEAYLNQDLINRELRIWDEAQDRFSDLPPLMQRIRSGRSKKSCAQSSTSGLCWQIV